MSKNNLYNFKNPLRHFLNIDKVEFNEDLKDKDITKLSWSEPIKFRIWKSDEKYRVLKLPNILNFLNSIEVFKNYDNFLSPHKFDENHKRLIPNLKTGDFKAGVYDTQLENDFYLLSVYENLIKLDIKAYYERIYTHDITFNNGSKEENFLTNLNSGNTNGLIMGNYLSLFFGEKYLAEISKDIEKTLEDKGIDCDFSYFSDDFYFFCDVIDNNTIISVFDKVLEKYNLERKEDVVVWDYVEYNEQNLSERYWKKIISESKQRFKNEIDNNKLYFTNQLIYRLSKIKEKKYKMTFLNTFFKSNFLNQLPIEKYEFQFYNFHNLCYIFKLSPETLIYSINIIKKQELFEGEKFKKFLETRFKAILMKPFNDHQLYYYYTIKSLGFNSILRKYRDLVIESDNQVLISYYLKDKLFTKKHVNFLKTNVEEKYWFQNYHLILYTDLFDSLEDSVEKYLVPIYAKKDRQKVNYRSFYKLNLEKKIPLINDLKGVEKKISDYKLLLMSEREEVFNQD